MQADVSSTHCPFCGCYFFAVHCSTQAVPNWIFAQHLRPGPADAVQVACVLLPLSFFYDVFWVFIQPYLTHGDSVMVKVPSHPLRAGLFCMLTAVSTADSVHV